MNKVILADSQAIFRAGTAKVLATDDDYRIIAQCSDTERMMHAATTFPGSIVIFASTLKPEIPRLRVLLETMGSKLWPLGDAPERANVAKIAGNFMLAAAIESMAEATALTRAHGVSAADFLEVMTNTLFAAPAYQGYGKLIAEQRFKPAGFTLPLGLKDVELALTAGSAARVPLPFAGVLRDSLLEALAAGDAELDWSALALVAARRAHLEERS